MKAAAGRYAGLFVVAALQFYWYHLPAPLAMKVLTAVFTAVCIASPQSGFMLLALMAPISTAISSHMGGLAPPGLLLEQLVLAACMGALVRFESGPTTRLGPPSLVIAAIALASAVAMAPASAAATTPPGIQNGPYTFWMHLLDRGTVVSSPVWPPFFAAFMIAESCLLSWLAERAMRRTPALVTRLLWMLLIGHAGAALLGVNQVIGIGGLVGFKHWLLTARLSPQMEVHAAGSALLLTAVAGTGLIAGSRARRVSVVLLVAIVALGLWISGSRLAIGTGAVIGSIALGRCGLKSSRRTVVAIAGALVVLAVGWFAVVPDMTNRYSDVPVSVRARIMMAETAVRLFSTAPVFGIGIDQFYGASAGALDPEFAALSGYARENAHNNFLQVGAEQGVVGLAAMLWWLGLLGAGFWEARRTQAASLARNALALGVLGCVATWLGGHPLLVREFSTVFFFYAAILAAMTPAAQVIHTRTAAVALVILLASLPVRATILRNQAWLENQGFGLSRWMRDSEYRYREAGAESEVYVPSGATVQLPLRLAGEGPATGLAEVHLGGRVVQQRRIGPDQWRVLDVVVPPSRKRFQLAKVTVKLDNGIERHGPIVLVGRLILR